MEIVDILSLLVPNIYTAITQLCASAILFFLMYKLAWKPVKKILDERSDYEQSKLEEAEKLQAENEKVASQAKEVILDANKTAEEIVREARVEAQEIKDEMILEGKKEAQSIIDNTQKDIELQKAKMMKDVQEQLVDATISATEKMLQTNIDPEIEKENIDSFIKEVIDQ